MTFLWKFNSLNIIKSLWQNSASECLQKIHISEYKVNKSTSNDNIKEVRFLLKYFFF